MIMIKYSDNPLEKIKEHTPFFYEIYNLSVFMAYMGFIIISFYFMNLAYTINTPSYDILCLNCKLSSHIVNVSLLLVWLFFLYFYILNEIRFRFAHYSGRKQDKLIKRNNIFYIILSFAFTIFTMFIIY